MPSAFSTPSSPRLSGNARCASCPSMLGAPGLAPSTCVIAPSTGALQLQRGDAGAFEYGTTSGARVRVPARSPSTIAASGRWPPLAAVAAPMLERRQLRRPGVAAAAAARRCEHDRALGLARGEHARELQQRGGARQFRDRSRRRGVAVGEDHDRRGAGRAGTLRDDGAEGAFAIDRLRVEVIRAHQRSHRRRCPRGLPARWRRSVPGPRRRHCRHGASGSSWRDSAVPRTRVRLRRRRVRASR